MLLIFHLTVLNALKYDTNRIHCKSEHTTREEHQYIDNEHFHLILGSDISITHGDHCHGSPIESIIIFDSHRRFH